VHVFGEPAVHVPAWQVSLRVQAFPSLQVVPFAFAGLEQVPLTVSQVPAVWHWSSTVHVFGAPGLHAPPWQVSTRVQALPSLHADPLALAGLEQMPLVVSQVPAVWQWSDAAHVFGAPGLQAPPWQVSTRVQALPSLHADPFALAGLEQFPLAVSHTPGSWHWSEAVQVFGAPALHTPAWHVSVRVQAFPSLQADPFVLAGFEQAPLAVSQVPAV
jgi:hypothetical protein